MYGMPTEVVLRAATGNKGRANIKSRSTTSTAKTQRHQHTLLVHLDAKMTAEQIAQVSEFAARVNGNEFLPTTNSIVVLPRQFRITKGGQSLLKTKLYGMAFAAAWFSTTAGAARAASSDKKNSPKVTISSNDAAGRSGSGPLFTVDSPHVAARTSDVDFDFWIHISETHAVLRKNIESFLRPLKGYNLIAMDACWKAHCARPLGFSCVDESLTFNSLHGKLQMHKPLRFRQKSARGPEWGVWSSSFVREVAEVLVLNEEVLESEDVEEKRAAGEQDADVDTATGKKPEQARTSAGREAEAASTSTKAASTLPRNLHQDFNDVNLPPGIKLLPATEEYWVSSTTSGTDKFVLFPTFEENVEWKRRDNGFEDVFHAGTSVTTRGSAQGHDAGHNAVPPQAEKDELQLEVQRATARLQRVDRMFEDVDIGQDEESPSGAGAGGAASSRSRKRNFYTRRTTSTSYHYLPTLQQRQTAIFLIRDALAQYQSDEAYWVQALRHSPNHCDKMVNANLHINGVVMASNSNYKSTRYHGELDAIGTNSPQMLDDILLGALRPDEEHELDDGATVLEGGKKDDLTDHTADDAQSTSTMAAGSEAERTCSAKNSGLGTTASAKRKSSYTTLTSFENATASPSKVKPGKMKKKKKKSTSEKYVNDIIWKNYFNNEENFFARKLQSPEIQSHVFFERLAGRSGTKYDEEIAAAAALFDDNREDLDDVERRTGASIATSSEGDRATRQRERVHSEEETSTRSERRGQSQQAGSPRPVEEPPELNNCCNPPLAEVKIFLQDEQGTDGGLNANPNGDNAHAMLVTNTIDPPASSPAFPGFVKLTAAPDEWDDDKSRTGKKKKKKRNKKRDSSNANDHHHIHNPVRIWDVPWNYGEEEFLMQERQRSLLSPTDGVHSSHQQTSLASSAPPAEDADRKVFLKLSWVNLFREHPSAPSAGTPVATTGAPLPSKYKIEVLRMLENAADKETSSSTTSSPRRGGPGDLPATTRNSTKQQVLTIPRIHPTSYGWAFLDEGRKPIDSGRVFFTHLVEIPLPLLLEDDDSDRIRTREVPQQQGGRVEKEAHAANNATRRNEEAGYGRNTARRFLLKISGFGEREFRVRIPARSTSLRRGSAIVDVDRMKEPAINLAPNARMTRTQDEL
ncbi:unnamed protein product [Amoebophrya sp. A120]|nr:unnamed protein product [Amoebophrya sp. A120]|eukprot:GSA120T00015570001.1